MNSFIKELYKYRYLIQELVVRDIKKKYRRSECKRFGFFEKAHEIRFSANYMYIGLLKVMMAQRLRRSVYSDINREAWDTEEYDHCADV